MRLSKTGSTNQARAVACFAAERRASSRFPLEEEARYRLIQDGVTTSGRGRTLNIGSGGVLFTTEERLPEGGKVEVAINWPVTLDGRCPLKFVASGHVLRSDGNSAAIRIDRYQFHTRATRPQ
jgi:hypothetical protein